MFASQPTPQLSQPASSRAQTKQDVSPRTWVSHVPLFGCLCCTCTLALHGMHHVLLATGLSKGSVLPGVTETCHWSTHTGQPKQCSAQGATRAAGASSSLVSTLVYTDHIERPGQTPHYTHTHTSHHKAGRACRCHWSQSAPATPTAAHSMNTGNPSHLQSHVTPFGPCKHRLSGRYIPAPPPAPSPRGA
jgi:hypothetical protein